MPLFELSREGQAFEDIKKLRAGQSREQIIAVCHAYLKGALSVQKMSEEARQDILARVRIGSQRR